MTEQAVSEKAVEATARWMAIEGGNPADAWDEAIQDEYREAWRSKARGALAAALPEIEAELREGMARWARQRAAEGRRRKEPHLHVEHWEKLAEAALSSPPHSGQPGDRDG